MRRLFETLPDIADTGSTVLIEGPSGSGQELFARHSQPVALREQALRGGRLRAPPNTLLESELFGYKAGGFTGTQRDKPGRFQLADGGTIFLD